jgi:hypothetical protein
MTEFEELNAKINSTRRVIKTKDGWGLTPAYFNLITTPSYQSVKQYFMTLVFGGITIDQNSPTRSWETC